ncbi:branched-chain amino acid transport system II carrier protein [Anaerococcus sp.]|uniref:branched-chain amino acid transport system II carrier protein n=1 Tax=Anaerococcus sp. TaxID=1872515 RepID=UPI0027BB07B1|nr:branched-chain amino acid transport system II carrier protein [Anaerococcus sp.]
MKKLSRSQFLQVSIMLFGLFFGAGNLIFPPLLGNMAGKATFISLLAFSVTAVVFPVLGAIVVGKTNGLSNLANRVGPVFALVFTTAIYLSIGPGLGIPRAGSVPFEMAIAPYIPESFNMNIARLVYTFIFFAIALAICLRPSKLVERVGKFLTPALLLLIAFMFFKIVTMDKSVGAPTGDYLKSPVTKGFLAGYDTMDAVAALNFGFVIAQAIKRFGIDDEKKVTKYEVKAGLVAGSVLFVVYWMLSTIGMIGSAKFVGLENGAQVLTESIKLVLGDFGLVLLAFIFTLACLTTCVGLISSGGEYFEKLFNERLSYKAWVCVWSLFSFIMANFGLNKLLEFSVLLLQIIYPVALVLIVMGISQSFLNFTRESYLAGAAVSVGLPLVEVMDKTFHLSLGPVTRLVQGLPMYEAGLSWLLPTLIVVELTSLLVKVFAREVEVEKVRQKY